MKNLLGLFAMLFLLGTGFTACGDAETKQNAETNTENTVKNEAEAQAVQVVNKEKEEPKGYKVGDTAVDFKLKNIDGKMVSLSDFADAKGFIVTFTCNHCPYAVMYEDRLIDLHNRYAPKGYPVIAINPNDPEVQPKDSYELMQERAKDKGFPFVYLMDEGQKVYPQYGATKTPHVFLLSKDLVVQYIGAIDDNHKDASAVKTKYVENAISAIEKGEKPNPDFTKAIGCSVKCKKS